MESISSPSYSKMRIRIAALCLFVAQGLVFASWASRLPDISENFGVRDLMEYGILMFLIPIGKFVAIPFVGFLFPRIGSKKTVMISIIGFVLSLGIIGFVPVNITILGILMVFFGTFWNMTDISLNTQAIEVERIYGKPIIATFHASWSLSACIGAIVGYGMINMGINPQMHFIIVTIIALVLILVNLKYLPEAKVEAKATVKKDEEVKGIGYMIKNRIKPELLLIQLGLIWLLALIVENTMFEWGDIFYQQVIQAPKSMRVGFLVFMVMMFAGRMITNFLYRIWSKTTVLQVAGVLLFFGFFTASISIFLDSIDSITLKVIITSIGFMMIGLGISCVVPTLYSIVAEKAKTPAGLALTLMSSISFAGPLLQPIMVGGISHKFGLEWAYLAVGLVGLCIVAITIVSKTLRK